MDVPHLSRREMLRLSAGALLTIGLWPGRLHAADAPTTSDFRFVVINDLHYAADECTPFFEGMVKRVNSLDKHDFILIVGDLVDAGTPEQCAGLKKILDKLAAPYHVVPGNHDAASMTDRKPWHDVFGKEMNYTFENNGWQFVALDTTDGNKSDKFDCHKETLDYAAAVATKLDKKKPTVVYTHFPLGTDVKFRLGNADALLEPFKALNLQAIYNGHYHAFTERKLNSTVVTTNKCCSRVRNNHDQTIEKGLFACSIKNGSLNREFVEYGTPAATAPANPSPQTLPAVQ